jgi:trans-aconitate methyltransferase
MQGLCCSSSSGKGCFKESNCTVLKRARKSARWHTHSLELRRWVEHVHTQSIRMHMPSNKCTQTHRLILNAFKATCTHKLSLNALKARHLHT